MKRFKGLHKPGRFTLSPDVEVEGELFFAGQETRLDLTSGSYFHTHNLPSRSICGTLSDRSRVSLLECVTTQGPGSGPTLEGGRYYFSTVLPNLVVLGNEFLTADDEKIVGLSVVLQDAHAVFYDFRVYGEMSGEAADTLALIKQHGHAEASFGDDPRWPMIFYYTGKGDIFECETALGQISAAHTPTFRTSGVRGIRIKDKISLTIKFRNRVASGTAIDALHVLLRFFELVIGRHQNIQDLRFSVVCADEGVSSQEVYMCMHKRVKRAPDDRGPGPSEVLVRGAHEPDSLARILRGYVDREETWRAARIRLSDAMSSGNRYSADRVIAAANMFDLVPRSGISAPEPLSSEVESARAACQATFRALPVSDARAKALQDLSSLSSANLRHRVLDRARLVLKHAGGSFPELPFVLGKAVDCRNVFVHGPRPSTNMESMYEAMPFLCNSLEFVFGTSDLSDGGWDFGAWLARGSSMQHPYGSFAVNYSLGLSNLKKLFP